MTIKIENIHQHAEKMRAISNEIVDSLADLTHQAAGELEELEFRWHKAKRPLRDLERELQKPASEAAKAARDIAAEMQKSCKRILASLR